jgi:hypothetical protein
VKLDGKTQRYWSALQNILAPRRISRREARNRRNAAPASHHCDTMPQKVEREDGAIKCRTCRQFKFDGWLDAGKEPTGRNKKWHCIDCWTKLGNQGKLTEAEQTNFLTERTKRTGNAATAPQQLQSEGTELHNQAADWLSNDWRRTPATSALGNEWRGPVQGGRSNERGQHANAWGSYTYAHHHPDVGAQEGTHSRGQQGAHSSSSGGP